MCETGQSNIVECFGRLGLNMWLVLVSTGRDQFCRKGFVKIVTYLYTAIITIGN